MISSIRDSLLSLVFPRFCLACGGGVDRFADGAACGDCWDKTTVFHGHEAACWKCGLILNRTPSDHRITCGRCENDSYDRAVSAALYHHAARASVLQLKEQPFAAPRVRRLLTDRFDNSGFYSGTMIVPVPLSRRRLMERGFNQAELLARVLSGHTGIPVAGDVVERTRHFAMHRAGMDKKARGMSVKNAFSILRPKKAAGEKILLVDDVYTTGSTASACAAVLKKAGAREVCLLTLARTPYY